MCSLVTARSSSRLPFGAVLTSRAEDWAPLSLVGLLFVLATGSELLSVEIRDLRLSGSFVSFVLAMALLGPARPRRCAACMLLDAAVSRNALDKKLVNVTTFATVGLAGGLAMEVLRRRLRPALRRPAVVRRRRLRRRSWRPTRSTS